MKEATPSADDCQFPKLKLLLKYMFSCLSRSPVQCNDLCHAIIYGKTTRTMTLSFAYLMFKAKSHFFETSKSPDHRTQAKMQLKNQQRPLLFLRCFLGLRCQLPEIFRSSFPEGTGSFTRVKAMLTAIGFSRVMMHLIQ